MLYLKDGAVGADIAGGCETQAADKSGTQIRQDIAVQVRHHQHVILARILKKNKN